MKEWTIKNVHEAMAKGELTCLELVRYYLERINKYDGKLHSIILVNLKQKALPVHCTAYRLF